MVLDTVYQLYIKVVVEMIAEQWILMETTSVENYNAIAMDETQDQYYSSSLPEISLSHDVGERSYSNGQINRGTGISGLKKRGHGSRSWIKIGRDGNFQTVTLDKATIMRHCSLPSRDLRLLDPMFIYPSAILGREKAIVVNLEQIRCIITADEVILMNSLDGSVGQYRSELCNRLENERAGKEGYKLILM